MDLTVDFAEQFSLVPLQSLSSVFCTECKCSALYELSLTTLCKPFLGTILTDTGRENCRFPSLKNSRHEKGFNWSLIILNFEYEPWAIFPLVLYVEPSNKGSVFPFSFCFLLSCSLRARNHFKIALRREHFFASGRYEALYNANLWPR